MSVLSVASIGSIATATAPLQTTVGIAAAIVFSLLVFVGVMVYLAFGPHNTVLQDDETPIGRGRDRSTAGESGAGPESDAEAVQGQDQPDEPTAGEGNTGGDSDGPSST